MNIWSKLKGKNVKEAIAFQGGGKMSKLPKMVLEGGKLGQQGRFIP